MSNGRQRLSARDYKNAGRGQPMFDLMRYRQFGIGLAVGLGAALLVWIYDHRVQPQVDELTEVSKPATRAEETAPSAAADSENPAGDYTFYDMLPKFEVTVPESDHGVRRDQPEPVTRPGVYVLQVGSYRGRPDAERLRDKLAKMGIEAIIQHVSIDADEWHRVRIGPITDLAKLNATRRQLRTADMDALIQRVGD